MAAMAKMAINNNGNNNVSNEIVMAISCSCYQMAGENKYHVIMKIINVNQ